MERVRKEGMKKNWESCIMKYQEPHVSSGDQEGSAGKEDEKGKRFLDNPTG